MFQVYSSLKPEARVWVYQANRALSSKETQFIEEASEAFCEQWQSHGSPLTTSFRIVYDQFLILVAEDQPKVSGCSIDSSVHFVKEMGDKIKVDFFDRMTILFKEAEETVWSSCHFSEVDGQIDAGKIKGNTLVFNNMIRNKYELENHWELPAKASWLANRLPKALH